MKSMTGYGKSEFSDKNIHIEVEIKSVNSRYIDIKSKLPLEIIHLENEVKNLISKNIKRGKIDLKIQIVNGDRKTISVDNEKLSSYKKMLEDIQSTLDKEVTINFSDLLLAEGIIKIEKNQLPEEIEKNILQILDKAIQNHQNMAIKEGEAMLKFFVDSIAKMKLSIKNIDLLFPAFKEFTYNKIRDNIENLLEEKLNEEQLHKLHFEAVIYIDKADVTEEIVRFNSHLNNLECTMKISAEPLGKKMNFILQEMHREINTIGAKFNTENSFKDILLIKEEIEKCREMVQNVE